MTVFCIRLCLQSYTVCEYVASPAYLPPPEVNNAILTLASWRSPRGRTPNTKCPVYTHNQGVGEVAYSARRIFNPS